MRLRLRLRQRQGRRCLCFAASPARPWIVRGASAVWSSAAAWWRALDRGEREGEWAWLAWIGDRVGAKSGGQGGGGGAGAGGGAAAGAAQHGRGHHGVRQQGDGGLLLRHAGVALHGRRRAYPRVRGRAVVRLSSPTLAFPVPIAPTASSVFVACFGRWIRALSSACMRA
jgi:hypothetical protein